jgi:hypothetical protein
MTHPKQEDTPIKQKSKCPHNPFSPLFVVSFRRHFSPGTGYFWGYCLTEAWVKSADPAGMSPKILSSGLFYILMSKGYFHYGCAFIGMFMTFWWLSSKRRLPL